MGKSQLNAMLGITTLGVLGATPESAARRQTGVGACCGGNSTQSFLITKFI